MSVFLISIKMTVLGRDVYPHPGPPALRPLRPLLLFPHTLPTTYIIMSRSKITFEFQEVKLLIQMLPKTIKTSACLSPVTSSFFPDQSFSLSSPLLSERPFGACCLSPYTAPPLLRNYEQIKANTHPKGCSTGCSS